MPRQLCIDIETTALDTDVPASFEDLSTWTIFAVGLGFRPSPAAAPEVEVLLRDPHTPDSERRLLARVVNWVREREPVDTLVTYNGENFDLPVLEQRAEALLKSDRPHEQSLSFALFDALDIPHRDLFNEIKQSMPEEKKWPTLDESLENRGIEAGTPMYDGEPVTGAKMSPWGRQLLDSVHDDTHFSAVQKIAVRQYVRSDIEPLFALVDALDEERRERIEAEAAATARGQSATNTEDR